MSVKLLIEHHFEFLSLKEPAQARLSLQLSKYHIVGNHMSRLIFQKLYNNVKGQTFLSGGQLAPKLTWFIICIFW